MEKEPVRYVLKGRIAEDQRKYVEGVREFLNNGLKGKGKIVGGPRDDLSAEQRAEYDRMMKKRFPFC